MSDYEMQKLKDENARLLTALTESQRTIRALRMVNALKSQMRYAEVLRGKTFGIACDTDDYAIRWQTLDKRLTVVRQSLAEGGE